MEALANSGALTAAHLRPKLDFRAPLLLPFLVVVLGHWAEHVFQAIQIYVLGWPAERALGALGIVAPALVRSEWLHWGFNLTVLAGLAFLLPNFTDRARVWWSAALIAQGWHFFEHALLLGQAWTGLHLFGGVAPTSIAQLVIPRVELHLLYNGVVTALLLAGLLQRATRTAQMEGRNLIVQLHSDRAKQ